MVIAVILFILPPVIPRFYTYILAVIFVTSLLAMSLNLVVGHGGLFQFHHAVFYGIGAYSVALIATRTSLPIWIGFIAGPIIAAFAGLLIGWFCIRLTR
ncbi:MAG: branched-chain amino acid ABC transporter permease, partial [Deltaproteobacteria bacterium]|nr:branched-chain amino acid ABC transporter permease [Deltaproteobacteria bacterium]